MQDRNVVQAQLMAKSMGLAFVLTLVLGGLGMMYVSVFAGLLALAVDLFLYVLGTLTLGIGYIFLAIWRIMCLVYVIMAVSRHNRRLIKQIDR